MSTPSNVEVGMILSILFGRIKQSSTDGNANCSKYEEWFIHKNGRNTAEAEDF